MHRFATWALCGLTTQCCPGASTPATPPEGASGADLVPSATFGPGTAPPPVLPVPAAAEDLADACTEAGECESGICEGEGCGTPDGRCVAKDRQCTADIQPYCGCDGVTFAASGSCPGRRYARRGRCEAGGR